MNTISRTHHERTAIQDELTEGIEAIYRALSTYEGKMFKVDGQQTKAFTQHLEPLQLNTKSSGHYFKGHLRVNINHVSVRAGYSSLELHIRATSTLEDQAHDINYIEHIIYLGKFNYHNYNYDFNRADLNSVFELKEQIESYNPIDLEDIQKSIVKRNKLLEQIKAVEAEMPYYSYTRN